MTREEAIQILSTRDAHGVLCGCTSEVTEALDMAIEALSEPINCVKCKHYYETEDDTDVHGHCKMDTAHIDLISRVDAIELCAEAQGRASTKSELKGISKVWQGLIKLPSTEVVQGWNKEKPTKQGQYIVTLDAWGHKYLDIMYYRKPSLPNREVNGACWYKPSSEWGDVVYDDDVIIAWMPLPKPYEGGGNE